MIYRHIIAIYIMMMLMLLIPLTATAWGLNNAVLQGTSITSTNIRGTTNIDVDKVIDELLKAVLPGPVAPFTEYYYRYSGRTVNFTIEGKLAKIIGYPVKSIVVASYFKDKGWVSLPARIYLYKTGYANMIHYATSDKVQKGMTLEFRLPPGNTLKVDPRKNVPWFARGSDGYILVEIKMRGKEVGYVYIFYGSHIPNDDLLANTIAYKNSPSNYEAGLECPPANLILNIPKTVLRKMGLNKQSYTSITLLIIREPVKLRPDGLQLFITTPSEGPIPDGAQILYNMVEFRPQPDHPQIFQQTPYELSWNRKSVSFNVTVRIPGETYSDALFTKLVLLVYAYRESNVVGSVTLRARVNLGNYEMVREKILYDTTGGIPFSYYILPPYDSSITNTSVVIEIPDITLDDKWLIRVFPIVFYSVPLNYLSSSKFLKPLVLAPVAGATYDDNYGVQYITLYVSGDPNESQGLEWILENPFMGTTWAGIIDPATPITIWITADQNADPSLFPQDVYITIGSATRVASLPTPGATVSVTFGDTLDDIIAIIEPYLYTGSPIPVYIKAVAQNGNIALTPCRYEIKADALRLYTIPFPRPWTPSSDYIYTVVATNDQQWYMDFYGDRGQVIHSFAETVIGKRVGTGTARVKISTLNEPYVSTPVPVKIEFSYYMPGRPTAIGDGYTVDAGLLTEWQIVVYGLYPDLYGVFKYPISWGNELPDIDTEIVGVLTKILPKTMAKYTNAAGSAAKNIIHGIVVLYDIIKRSGSADISINILSEGLKVSWKKALTDAGVEEAEIEVKTSGAVISDSTGYATLRYTMVVVTDVYTFTGSSIAKFYVSR